MNYSSELVSDCCQSSNCYTSVQSGDSYCLECVSQCSIVRLCPIGDYLKKPDVISDSKTADSKAAYMVAL